MMVVPASRCPSLMTRGVIQGAGCPLRTAAETQLTGLAAEKPRAADPSLLDELPYLGDILPGLPPALKTRLLDMFDVTVTWNKAKDGDGVAQVTVTAVLTDETLTALPEIDPRQDDTAGPAP
jgi:hypothetical protein